jgi:hypothetical protein
MWVDAGLRSTARGIVKLEVSCIKHEWFVGVYPFEQHHGPFENREVAKLEAVTLARALCVEAVKELDELMKHSPHT